jgi:hypothetical protein
LAVLLGRGAVTFAAAVPRPPLPAAARGATAVQAVLPAPAAPA